MSRSARIVATTLLALALLSVTAAPSIADPAEDLAAAEGRVAAAQPRVEAAEDALADAEAARAPLAAQADEALARVEAAEARLSAAERALVAKREAAAREVEAAKDSYGSEKAEHDILTWVGIAIAILAPLAGAGSYLYFSRSGGWPLSRTRTRVLIGWIAVVSVGGLALATIPDPPEVPLLHPGVVELAEAAEEAPAESPSPAMRAAQARLSKLQAEAAPLEARLARADEAVGAAEAALRRERGTLSRAEDQLARAERAVSRAEAEERAEASFREEATTIDYDQLIKNPEAQRGEKVVYTGQIFQIVEEGGIGFMLLSVTDEGYGFWDDNIWVNFFEPVGAAEEDIVTVYGKLTGSEEYETQIGGSTYVPRMNARYVDE